MLRASEIMSAKSSHISGLKRVVLAAALLGCPCGMLAQHGSPGGGGLAGSAGGGGLSGPAGRATGVSEKDELKDFRELLAVQATSQQIVQYAAMLKIAEAASAEWRSFQESFAKEHSGPELVSRSAALDQALERTRTENKKFLDGLSERQKSGLKET